LGPGRTAVAGRGFDRCCRDMASRGTSLHGQTDRASPHFRQAGRHRHRERAAAQRAAPAHPDLTESLEQQTAMSEVLRIISSSSGDLKPVFEAMLTSAMRICEAEFGNLWLYDGDGYRIQAMRGGPAALVEQWSNEPPRWGPDTGLGR